MKTKVLLFGQLKEKVNKDFIEFENLQDSSDLLTRLNGEFPVLSGITFRIAINKNLISENTVIDINSEVALLPPFSGG